MSVTSFGTWLRSPYLFYLERLLGLERADDAAHELDALRFGTLAHEVLAAFGADARVRDATDAVAVGRALSAALDSLVARRHGRHPLPAVVLQVEQLRRRLSAFAAFQALRAAEGWRIAACEWAPKAPVPLAGVEPPVTLRGRVDRIDVHADGRRWALLDYKTSNEPMPPGRAHRARDGTWRELQLPLYALLARPFAAERGLAGPPELGYLVLPRDVSKTGVLIADWSPEDLLDAEDAARRIVRAMRTEGYERLGRDFPEDDPLLAALAGIGLLSERDEDEDAGADANPGADAGRRANGSGAAAGDSTGAGTGAA
jgi:RecB family exonuclease